MFMGGTTAEATAQRALEPLTGVVVDIGMTLASVLEAKRFVLLGSYA